MTRLTRRGALGLGIAGLGAAACTTTGAATAYAGKAAFKHGVASGDPTQTGVVIWTRVTPEAPGPVPVAWACRGIRRSRTWSSAGRSTPGRSATTRSRWTCDGLEPGQLYYYWFSVGRTVVAGRRDADAAGERHGRLPDGRGVVLELAVRVLQRLSRDRQARGAGRDRRGDPPRRLHLRVWRDGIWRRGGQGARPQP